MNHRVGFNKLGLKESHRKSLHRNMAISLFRYERITTTKSKALAVKRTVEKMITKAKVDLCIIEDLSPVILKTKPC